MSPNFSRQNIAEELNELCLTLFDGWCERRCVIPLAYLMHSWPLVDATTGSFNRLHDNLHDLECWHVEDLSDQDSETIRYLLNLLSQQATRLQASTTGREMLET